MTVATGGARGSAVAWCAEYAERTGRDLPEAVEQLEAARAIWREAASVYRASTPEADPAGDRALHTAMRAAHRNAEFWALCAPVTTKREQDALLAEYRVELREAEKAAVKARRHERAVEREVDRLRVREDAAAALKAEKLAAAEMPEPVRLADLLAEPPAAEKFLVDRLWPSGGKVLLSAPAKAGKSTIVGNLIRSLVDEVPLFDHFAVARRCRVALLDFELSRDLIREWLADQEIENVEAVTVVPMLGRAGSFGILDEKTRSRWVDVLRGHDVLILDPLRPLLHALGLKEWNETGPLLQVFDALRTEAGVPEGLIVQHHGHSGERAAGDSNLLGWPDALWNVVRENPNDSKSFRFFSAYGRDIDVEPGLLSMYDGRRLAFAPEAAKAKSTSIVERVIDFLGEHPRSRRDDIIEAVPGLVKNAFSRLLEPLIEQGSIDVQNGPHGTKLYSLNTSS